MYALLFAYGTLMDPQRLAAVIGPGWRACIVGRGRVGGMLYDLGEYPALRPSDAATNTVPGVLLELDEGALAPLDTYEGVAEGLYARERHAVRLDDGRIVEAWVYAFSGSTDGLRRIASWPPERG